MGDFGVKEIYDVNFRLLYPDKIFGREYDADEIILRFDKLNIGVLNEYKTRTSANGGYLNKIQVYWDNPRAVVFNLTNGVISQNALSLLTNNRLYQKTQVKVPIYEKIDVIGVEGYNLKFPILLSEPYFLYRNGEKIAKNLYTFEDNKLILDDNNYADLEIDYYTLKENQNTLRIGQNLIGGFLKMEGKTRLKDDTDGQEKTGIIVIPKLRIMSDLSIRLGNYETPNIYNFTIEGYPTEGRTETYTCEIQFLDTDIDADIV